MAVIFYFMAMNFKKPPRIWGSSPEQSSYSLGAYLTKIASNPPTPLFLRGKCDLISLSYLIG